MTQPIPRETLEQAVTTEAGPTVDAVAAAMAPDAARVTVLVPESAMPQVRAAQRRALAAEAYASPAAPALADVSPLRARGLAVRLTVADHGQTIPVRCLRRADPPHAVHEGNCPRTPAAVQARNLGAFLESRPTAQIGDLVTGVAVDTPQPVLGVVVAQHRAPAPYIGWRYDVATAALLPTGEAATVRVHGGVTPIVRAGGRVPCASSPGARHDSPVTWLSCEIAHARAAIEAAATEGAEQ